VAVTAIVATSSVAVGAAAAPAQRAAATAPSTVGVPAAARGLVPVDSLGRQGRTVLYKPGATTPADIATVAPTQGPPTGPAARANAVTDCSNGPAAQICVTFTDFDEAHLGPEFAQAKAAYDAAVNVWANLLSSPVPITIGVDVASFGSNVLAATGPNNFSQFASGGPWYPVALANALAGRDLDPNNPDIVSTVGSIGDVDWYFGTDGQTPSGEYDFESVVLHEIGHGLGIFSVTDADDPQYGCQVGLGCVGNGGFRNLPSVYDTWLVATLSASSTNVGWLTTGPQGQRGAFGNYTAALHGALTGWNPLPSTSVQSCSAAAQSSENSRVLWAGPEATAANLGSWPSIYSPNPWNPGSSISHLDCHHYPWPGANSVLTPYVPDGEAVHAPGPIVLGMLRDIGWTETVAPMITGTLAAGPTPNPAVGSAYVQWKPATRGIDGVSPVTGYRVQSARLDGSGGIRTLNVAASATSAIVDGLTTGVPYWVSVTPLSAAPGPAYAANVVPQDLGPSYGNLISLVNDLIPNILGGPNANVAYGVLLQLSYPHTTTTVEELVALNAFVLDPVLGPLTRLYLAYFGRLPDPGGTTYWLARLRSGTSLSAVSNGFAGSPEFVNTYGPLDNAQFVTRVYQNVLGRAPDSGGYNYWLGRLAAGMTRGQLMVNFSESAEFKGNKAGTVRVVEAFWAMRQKIPTTTQVSTNSGLSSTQLFQGLLDQTIS
jgi:hypothetical protein